MTVERVDLEDLSFVGNGLKRPECVLCTSAGNLYTADWRDGGGVARTRLDGSVELYTAKDKSFEVRPNGVAIDRDGSFLLAHLGDENGGVFRLTRGGELTPVLTEVDGVPLPPTNYVLLDPLGRIWVTVSTRLMPRSLGYKPDVADGFVVLIDEQGARVVADGLGYTNEIQLHPSGEWVYINETFARKTSRYRVGADNSLSDREVVAEYGLGTYPDGLMFDVEGGFWVTSIVSNRVIRVAPDGSQTIVVEDVDGEHLDWVEVAFLAGEMGRPHLDNVKSERLNSISSLAFGGADLRTIYLGCLLGDSITTFKSPVAGVPPTHWEFD